MEMGLASCRKKIFIVSCAFVAPMNFYVVVYESKKDSVHVLVLKGYYDN